MSCSAQPFRIRPKVSICTLLLLLFCAQSSLGQSLVLNRFTSNDKLPAVGAFGLHQDQHGYIWIGSAGAFRFNGNSFEQKMPLDQVAPNGVYEIFQAGDDSLLYRLDHEMWYYVNDSLFPHPINHVIDSLDTYNHAIELFRIASKTEHQAFILPSTLVTINPTNGAYSLSYNKHTRVFQSNSGWFLEPTIRYTGSNKERKILFEFDNGFVLDSIFDLGETIHVKSYELGTFNGYPLLAIGSDLFFPYQGKIHRKRFDKRIVAFEDSPSGDLWISFTRGGIRLFDKTWNELTHPFNEVAFRTVTDMLYDDRGGFWISTVRAGLYYYPCEAIKVYKREDETKDNFVVDQRMINGDLRTVFRDGGLQWISNNTRQIDETVLFDINGLYVSDLTNHPHWGKIAATNHGVITCSDGLPVERSLNGYTGGFEVDSLGRTWMIGYNRLHLLNNDGTVSDWEQTHEERDARAKRCGKIHDICILEDRVVIAGRKGLCVQYSDTLVRDPYLDSLLMNASTAFIVEAKEQLYIGTRNTGVWTCPATDLRSIHQVPGLEDGFVWELYNDGDSLLWIGMKKGLFSYNMENGVIKYLGYADGLPSNRVFKIRMHEEQVFASTDNGIAVFDRSLMARERQPLRVNVNSIQGKNRRYSPHENHPKIEGNELQFTVDVLDYQGRDDVFLQYRILNNEESWRSTVGRVVDVASLPPGEYEAEFRSNDRLRNTSAVSSWKFQIPTPWTDTWIARSIFVAILFVGVYLLVQFFVSRAQAQLHKKQQDAQYQQMALSGQMNPHFLFNSLNSLQFFISKQDTRGATRYLERFTTLMRGMLENRTGEMVSLGSELKLVKAYLQLQTLRVRGGMQHEIIVPDDIDQEALLIPSMLIQPLVENAIWHGLGNSKSERLLTITVEATSHLRISIEDNGIGRKAAAENNKAKVGRKSSMALNLIRERLQVLHELHGPPFTMEFIDKTDPTGTVVELQFPFLKNEQ